MHRRDNRRIETFGEKDLRERNHLEDRGVDGKVI
jgi:hypothetical protein